MLNLIRVFDGSFGGATLFENPRYQSPNEVIVYDSDSWPSLCNRLLQLLRFVFAILTT